VTVAYHCLSSVSHDERRGACLRIYFSGCIYSSVGYSWFDFDRLHRIPLELQTKFLGGQDCIYFQSASSFGCSPSRFFGCPGT